MSFEKLNIGANKGVNLCQEAVGNAKKGSTEGKTLDGVIERVYKTLR